MDRWREVYHGAPNIFNEEIPLPPLDMPFTKTPDFFEKMEAIIRQDSSCPYHQHLAYFTENTKTLTPPGTPKSREKPKAMNFPVSKITIGQWTHTAVYPEDLKVKFYFAKKKLMWEILDDAETATHVPRLKRKIEIQWADVLSLKSTFHPHDETGTLQVELDRPPTFFMETNPQAGKHTQWKQMDQDFTLDQSASKHRIHTLHFSPGVLQKNWEKLVSSDSFWSKLVKVDFPTLPQSLYLDIGYGNSNNNNSINSSRYEHGFNVDETPSFNVDDDLLYHHPQGFGHFPMGEDNFNMATQFCANDGRQMKSFFQDNGQDITMNQLPGTQVIQPYSQLINRESGSQLNNLMIQDERQMGNTGEFRGSQAYALLETQTNSMYERSMYQAGPYLQKLLAQEGETQNMEQTHQDGSFQPNYICFDPYLSNNDGSMHPDL